MTKRKELYNFKGLGEAIKSERKSRKWTREEMSSMIGIAPRYLAAIENEGQIPSLPIVFEIATLLNISIDQFFFSNEEIKNYKQLDILLHYLEDNELSILIATAKAILELKEK